MRKDFVLRNNKNIDSCCICCLDDFCAARDTSSIVFGKELEITDSYYCEQGDYFEYIPLTMLKSRRF